MTPIRVPSPTRSRLAPIWAISVPSRMDSIAAAANRADGGKNARIDLEQRHHDGPDRTSASSGATNIAAPPSEFTLRTIHGRRVFASVVTCTSSPRTTPTFLPALLLFLTERLRRHRDVSAIPLTCTVHDVAFLFPLAVRDHGLRRWRIGPEAAAFLLEILNFVYPSTRSIAARAFSASPASMARAAAAWLGRLSLNQPALPMATTKYCAEDGIDRAPEALQYRVVRRVQNREMECLVGGGRAGVILRGFHRGERGVDACRDQSWSPAGPPTQQQPAR